MKKRLGAMVCVLVLLSMLTVFTVACNKDGFKINFYDGDSFVTSISTNGKEAITLPTDPVKAGYTFEGWFFEKEFINQLLSTTYEKTKLKAEVNVYAKWTAFTYTINCDNDGAITTVKATYDKAFTCPAPTKTDYVFQGWYNGETQITDNLGASLVTFKDENGKVFNLTAKWALQTEGMAISGTTLTQYTGKAKYVVIPDTVTSIGADAFRSCSMIKSLTIPNSVESIGGLAFYYCTGLTTITLPNSLKTIGYGAFFGCSKLTSIAIPANVTTIGGYPFALCGELNSITVDPNNTAYYSVDNCLINKSTKELISGCSNSVIPNDVTKIGDRAFQGCYGLKSITLPKSVTSIADYAFDSCSGLTSITVEAGNTKYHSAGNCIIETATNTLIVGCKNSVIPTDGSVTSIGKYAFSGCSGLTSITIPATVTTIGAKAFYNCTNLATINCEAANPGEGKLPAGWDANWKGSCKATVVWDFVAA